MANKQEIEMKVQKMLQSWLGSVKIDSDGAFVFSMDSTSGFGSIFEWSDGDFILNVWAPVLLDVPITNELCHYIATESFVLGNLSLNQEDSAKTGRLDFQYRILANDLDPSELRTAVSAVVTTADDLDDKLVKRFGGKRMIDE